MSGKLFAVLCFALFAFTAAKVIRRDTAVKPDVNSFQEGFEHAIAHLKSLEAKAYEAIGVENREQLLAKFKEGGEKIAKEADELATKVKAEAEKLGDNETVKDISASIAKLGDDLKKKNPETAADLEKAGQELQVIATNVKGLSQSQEVQNIKKDIGDLLEQLTNTVQNIAANVVKKD